MGGGEEPLAERWPESAERPTRENFLSRGESGPLVGRCRTRRLRPSFESGPAGVPRGS